MKYAYVVNDVVQMVTYDDPVATFGPEFGSLFVTVPDNVETWWIRDPLTGNYSAPPPPPLTINDFKWALDAFISARDNAMRAAKLQEALQLSPNYPALPNSVSDFVVILNGMEWPA